LAVLELLAEAGAEVLPVLVAGVPASPQEEVVAEVCFAPLPVLAVVEVPLASVAAAVPVLAEAEVLASVAAAVAALHYFPLEPRCSCNESLHTIVRTCYKISLVYPPNLIHHYFFVYGDCLV